MQTVNVKARPPQGGEASIKLDKKPNTCPICHYSIQPIGSLAACFAIAPDNGEEIVQAIYRCPRSRCSHFFVAQYNKPQSGPWMYTKSMPKTAKPAQVEKQVSDLSPEFVKIYNQAFEAEAHGLDDIFGVALRKALEFLVKDYCIDKHPDKEEEIKAKFLGTCIKEFVDDPKIKQCAEKAAWLGNDQTHYVRKWGGKDIGDLKTLIQLSMNWIVNEKLTEEYMKSFESPEHSEPA